MTTKHDDDSQTCDPLLPLIVRAVYWIDESLQNILISKGLHSFPRTKSMILANILLGVGRPSVIAKNIGLTRQAVHQTVNELIDEGILILEKDPTDGRAKSLNCAMMLRSQNSVKAVLTHIRPWKRP
ncbi:MAG: hypothetical protein CMF31_03740 [Kordiimonas sp.]|nr:hypothetical protein [Kordiimonas sp.]